jgi:restriction system protein
VQVKSGSGNVGYPEVLALLGTLSTGEFGRFATLAGFTPPARNFAKGKANLRLIDGGELVQLVLAHYEQFDSRYKGLPSLQRVFVPQPIDGDGD